MSDIERRMQLNLDPVLQASLAVQPGMRAAGGG